MQTGFRFAPHVLVFPLVLALSVPVMRRCLVSWDYWWYGASYRQVTFVMDEFHTNSGAPYIAGHFEGESEPRGLLAIDDAGRGAVKAVPSLAFAPGVALPVWYSPAAPLTTYFGEEANILPVAARPVLPGARTFALYLIAEGLVLYAAIWLTGWVYRRTFRESGILSRRSSTSLIGSLSHVQVKAEAYTRAWCDHDAEAVASFFATDAALAINGGPPSRGRPAIAAAAQGFMAAFPDLEVAMESVVQRGDRFVYAWILTGTNTGPGGAGSQVRIRGTETWALNTEGEIVESVGQFDAADLERQRLTASR